MRRSRSISKEGSGGTRAADPPSPDWHALSIEKAYELLETTSGGLSEAASEQRLREFGPNELPSEKSPGIFRIFLRQFLSPLIYVLIAAGAIALFVGEMLDAGFIFIVILINAVVGTIQEAKAEKEAEQLQRLIRTTARVRRGGTEVTVPAEGLVPGDIVLLESGNVVPADIRLASAVSLAIDESLLTGEAVAIDKRAERAEAGAPVSDRWDMAFAGSTVVRGRGEGAVVGTGLRTEIGEIAETVSQTEKTKPPLLIRMERFSKQISYVVVAAAAAMSVFALLRGVPLLDVFFLAIALAVAAIPEGLPVAVTIALAVRVKKMAERHVLIRRLAAVESLGSCTTIASDKTGTLTVNKQTVKVLVLPGMEPLRASGEGYEGEGEILTESGAPPGERERAMAMRIVEAGILCNDGTLVRSEGGWKHSGDSMDVALLSLGYKTGMDPAGVRASVNEIASIPFESERRYAAKFYSRGGGPEAAVKGALEVVLPMCSRVMGEEGPLPLDNDAMERESHRLMSQGYRVLAVAGGEVGEDAASSPDGRGLRGLTLLGLVGFIDPPRQEAKAAIEKAKCAGIKTIMVTGDHPSTALTIAGDLGIASGPEQLVSGRELEELGGPEVPKFVDRVKQGRVFARVTPIQKLEIVDVLINEGEFVAVTGDGVNDAPALKKANIGVAVGSGTDVAKGSSSIIVTDDNFASIIAGVEEGRYAYENIRKVTYLLVSTGVAEITLFILALLFGLPGEGGAILLPLMAIQLLWLNVVTNGIQHIALAMEGGDPNVMNLPPRDPSEGMFDRLMVREVAVSGLTIGAMAFTLFYLLVEAFGRSPFEATNLTFLFMVLIENVHVFNCRSERESILRIPAGRNRYIFVAVLAAQAVNLIAMHVPLTQELLSIAPVSLTEWLTLLAYAAILVAVMEVFKYFERKRIVPICGPGGTGPAP
ncbi:cation-translocating P-type ATPase [Methanomassiliicoccus luminyensis]|uniref:cation-translocating P-type ATPase n=1 Tax=Methanomassiliicoccus luminyensis TaxID=1080712 RepID=UPI0003761631|nr:HAD-IC family P-type ATPase [Methanomassiliicoccus luminyensis]